MADARGDFVGRSKELRRFTRALESARARRVFVIHGPGGVGKTTLLARLASACAARRVPVANVDVRHLERVDRRGVLGDVAAALGISAARAAPLDALRKRRTPYAILVDTAERDPEIAAWLLTSVAASLGPRGVLVVAGRAPPPPSLAVDSFVRERVDVIALRNFTADESERYLARRGVPRARRRPLLAASHGSPLALALLAELPPTRAAAVRLEEAPDVVRALLERFLDSAPGVDHRLALEVASMVRNTTQSTLAGVLDFEPARAHDVFAWLSSLSFMQAGPYGVFPHDLAREVIAAEARWRDPSGFADRIARAHSFLHGAHGESARSKTDPRAVAESMFLHRLDSPMQRAFELEGDGALTAAEAGPADRAALLAMVRAHEGEESARHAAEWLASAAARTVVLRARGDAPGAPAGFVTLVSLERAADDARDADPADAQLLAMGDEAPTAATRRDSDAVSLLDEP